VATEDLTAEVSAGQVGLQHSMPILILRIDVRARRINPRAVDQDINLAAKLETICQELLDRLAASDIHRQKRPFAA
jgi:hypothetical protein